MTSATNAPLNARFPYVSRQVITYLAVGVFNTAFGYGLFAGLTWLLTDRVPLAYLVASALGSVVSIAVGYVGYKFFVFKTRGHVLQELLRFYSLYGVTAVVNLALLPLVVWIITPALPAPQAAPYVAGALLTGGTVVVSYFGHKHYSFARSRPRDATSNASIETTPL